MTDSVDKPHIPERRLTPRVPGPFEGRRRGALTVDLRIYDLSVGGCLIEAFYDVVPGRRIRLDINLPHEGWITVDGETLYVRPNYGFAVKFVDLPEDTRSRIENVVSRLRSKSEFE
jgi:hypothetical protein